MKIPDLLYPTPYLAVDRRALEEALGLAFLGRELGTQLHDQLAKARIPPRDRLRLSAARRKSVESSSFASPNIGSKLPGGASEANESAQPSTSAAPASPPFQPEFFRSDLFLRNLLEASFTLTIEHRSYPVNFDFLQRVIEHAPTDIETIELRQGILRELLERPGLRVKLEELYRELFDLMSLMKTPGFNGNVNLAAFRLDILAQLKKVIDQMEVDFASAESGLRRLHEAAAITKSRKPYRLLSDLLEYERGMAKLSLDVTIGADGRLRSFVVKELEENTKNPFHRAPGKRFVDAIRLGFRGYSQSRRELMNRLINEVFRQLADPMVPYVQLIGHIEFYLTSLEFKRQAATKGLTTSLPTFANSTNDSSDPGNIDGNIDIQLLFNPLLLSDPIPPTPCSLSTNTQAAVVLITGPNSGGKTRLLQALGLTQLLAQSGTFVPCSSARLQLQSGMFVSLIEEEGARVTEGRLGRELVRIRSLFEQMAPGSLVILDELCSGTNPSEGVEVFTLVLQLLQEVKPTAYVTTHFLDYARSQKHDPVIRGLEFLQVEVDDDLRSTYQFVEGVADTSLAAVTATRLGVTFELLVDAIRKREQTQNDDG